MRRWLHEGLNTSAQVSGYCPSKTAQKQFIKCHFFVGSKALRAWVCSVLDPQDSIKELLNCVLRVSGQKTAARCGPPLVKL